MKRTVPAVLLTLVATFSVAMADVELILTDGQVLRGVDVQLRDGQYLLELDADNMMSIPIELVTEVKLVAESDEPGPPPDGYTVSDPQDLAGKRARLKVGKPQVLAGPPEIPSPPTREELLEELGEPAEFVQGVFDPRWYPTSDWEMNPRKQNNFAPTRWARSVLDVEWDPELAYDPDADVTEFSPVRWSSSPIDVTWYPQDGFKLKKLFFQPQPAEESVAVAPEETGRLLENAVPSPELSAKRTEGASSSRVLIGTPKRPGEPVLSAVADRESCARQVLQSLVQKAGAGEAIQVDVVEGDQYAALPIELYEGRVGLEDQSYRAMFTIVEGECHPLNGDLDHLLADETSGALKNFPVSVAFNAALRAIPFPRSASDGTKIDYAFAVVSLVEAGNRALQSSVIDLIENEGALRRLTQETVQTCEVSNWNQRREVQKAIDAFEEPVVTRQQGMEVVRMNTWTRQGGHVKRYTVRISPAGKATLESKSLASHVGPHIASH